MSLNVLKRLSQAISGSPARRRQGRRLLPQMALEKLETKQLLSATANLVGDTLQIRGDQFANYAYVDIGEHQTRVYASGMRSKVFRTSQIQNVQIGMKGGNDRVTLNVREAATNTSFHRHLSRMNVAIWGNSGHDQIAIRSRTDALDNVFADGGSGWDRVTIQKHRPDDLRLHRVESQVYGRLARAQRRLADLSSGETSIYKQLPTISMIVSNSYRRSFSRYADVIDQFDVGNTSRDTNLSNRYTRGGYGNQDTRCNIFAADVMRAMNAPLPTKSSRDPMTRNANGLNDWLNKEDRDGGAWVKIDPTSPGELARLIRHVRSGRPALASMKVRGSSGHIAVVRPEQPRFVRSIGDIVIAQAGAQNMARGTVTQGFGTTRGVEFFIHV